MRGQTTVSHVQTPAPTHEGRRAALLGNQAELKVFTLQGVAVGTCEQLHEPTSGRQSRGQFCQSAERRQPNRRAGSYRYTPSC